MFKQSLVFAAATAVVLATTGPAIAQSTDISTTSFDSNEMLLANRLDDEFKKNRGELLDKLDLSATQKQQMKAIRDEYQPQLSSLMSQLRSAQETMKSLAQSNASRSQLESQYQTVSSLRNQFSDLKFEQMLEVREVLTVAQRREMVEFMAEKKQERGGFFSNR